MTTEVGRALSDLRVCDLKEELEKRSLEVSGNKNVLIERLQKALEDEGHDPETYTFVALDKRTPKKPLKGNMRTDKVNGDIIDPNIVIKVEINDDDEEEEEELVDEIGTVDNEEYDENDVSADASNTDTGVNDNEESINLTIEEDEQKLLHAQAPDDKDKKTGSKAENGSDGGSATGDEKENNKTKGSEDTKKGGNSETAGGDDKKKHTDDDKKKKDDSEQKSSSKTATSKDEKDKSATGSKSKASSSSRNLWVSGLSSITRASDLKTIFSKYGKVIGAKVVTNTRTPGTRCYGYVTMASSSDTSKCIEHLHRTELHGRIISVERTKSEISGSSSSATSGGGAATKKDEKAGSKSKERRKSEEKEGKENEKKKPIVAPAAAAGEEETADSVNGKKLEHDEKAKSEASSRRDTRTSRSSRDRNRPERPRRTSIDRERDRQREILSFQKIREERERQRLRERERELREEERRRRDIRRRQREEEQRLAREREKLREERERLEREKAELLRLERERQKLEREKIELERLELKRQQMKIMQSSRIEDPKRAIKRPAETRYSETDRKRSTNERRFEAPPPPRFDTSLANRSVTNYDRSTDKKRDDYTSSKRDDYKRSEVEVSRHSQHSQHSSNYQGSRDTHNTHKDSRYTEPDTRSNFRRATDDRDSRNSGNKRFEATSYTDRSSGSTSQWHNQGPPAIKSFTGSNMGSGGGGGSGGMPVWQSKSSSDSHWKPVESSQDRYDRTYNERSGQYVDFSRQGMFVGRPQDRYSGQMSSRYQNGEY